MRLFSLSSFLILVAFLTSACGGDPNDSVSKEDQELMGRASDLGFQFQEGLATYSGELARGELDQAQDTLDGLGTLSAKRLQIIGQIENDPIRTFYFRIQPATDRALNLYQRVLSTAKTSGLTDADFSRFEQEEIQLAKKTRRLFRTESRKLDLSDDTINRILQENIDASKDALDDEYSNSSP